MSDFVVPNIICFQTHKQLATLNNTQVLLKSVLIDLRVDNFVHVTISLMQIVMHLKPCSLTSAHHLSYFLELASVSGRLSSSSVLFSW